MFYMLCDYFVFTNFHVVSHNNIQCILVEKKKLCIFKKETHKTQTNHIVKSYYVIVTWHVFTL